jgi:uncharacterized Zn finger protein
MKFKPQIHQIATQHGDFHAMKVVEGFGRGITAMIEMSDPARLDRASHLGGSVIPVCDCISSCEAKVKGSGDNVYNVKITFGTLARSACDCPDFGTNGPCKHAIAVGNKWLEHVARPTWRYFNLRDKANQIWESAG